MTTWHTLLTLNSQRETRSGSETDLVEAIRAGADMRVGSAFRHNEHIDPQSDSRELIREATDFRITYLLDDRWVAGIENLRLPIEIPEGFGPRVSMSFFLYNQDGYQAVARPYLDGREPTSEPGEAAREHYDYSGWPKYREFARFDDGTNAPSCNFAYDFEYYHFMVRSNWTEVLAHDAEGNVTGGNVEDLDKAVTQGSEVKIAIRALCDDLVAERTAPIDHEVFIHLGACFYYTEQKLFIGSANPVVRTAPSIPLGYSSRGWDFGWLMPRSDGHVARWLCDPYTLEFRRDAKRYAMRWFVEQ